MNEAFWINNEQQDINDGNKESLISSFDDGRKQLEEKATQYYLANKDNLETVQSLKNFIEWQEQDRTDLKEW